MVRSGAATDSGELPLGMSFYSFMFDESDALSELVAAERLPAPSSLAVGMAVGAALTAVRFALDFLLFKVKRGCWGWGLFIPPRTGRSVGYACCKGDRTGVQQHTHTHTPSIFVAASSRETYYCCEAASKL